MKLEGRSKETMGERRKGKTREAGRRKNKTKNAGRKGERSAQELSLID